MAPQSIFEFAVLAGTGEGQSVRVLIQVSGLTLDLSEPARAARRGMCQTMAEDLTKSAATLGIALDLVDVSLAAAIDKL